MNAVNNLDFTKPRKVVIKLSSNALEGHEAVISYAVFSDNIG